MWGNPIAEMMYETVRYFSGAGTPTAQFTYSSSDTNLDDNQLGLPLVAWNNPFIAQTIVPSDYLLFPIFFLL
jgi:type IV pilus assembly protein PilY1